MSPAESLAQRLARLHAETGATQAEFAARLGWGQRGQPRLSKILGGQQRPGTADVEAIARAAGRADLIPELLAARDDEQHRHRQWKGRLRGGHAGVQDDWYELLTASTVYQSVSPTYVPPLLQTPAYAAALIGQGARIFGTTDLQAAVAARMRRKALLYDPGPGRTIEIVTTEAGLALPPCPLPVMAAQLGEMAGVLRLGLPHLTVGVIPFGVPLHQQPTTDFVVLDGAVYVETAGGEDEPGPEEAAAYAAIFGELLGDAVTGDDALDLIAAWHARYDAA